MRSPLWLSTGSPPSAADLRDRASAWNAFNVAQYTSVGAGAVVLAALGAPLPVEDVTSSLPAVLAAVLVVFAVNHGLAGTAAALFGGHPVVSYMGRSATLHAWTDGFLIVLAPVVVAAADASLWLRAAPPVPHAGELPGKQALLSNHRAPTTSSRPAQPRPPGAPARRRDRRGRRCDTLVAVMLRTSTTSRP